ncbi:MAG: HDOD domain-containing protein [Candidatus Omnitrophica bacterium]|nr:HDOD domain-containing protein [Candidatus Omnitrophota bacterium]
MSAPDIQKVIGRIDKLPTLPHVVTTLTDLIRNPNTSAADIHQVISKDQSLSSRILRLVNSAFYGFSERISSISHAIVILGFNTVKNVALTASVFEMFPKESKEDVPFDRKAFWLHSFACASTTRLIARKVRIATIEDMFIAGLLHDVGKLVLDQFVHDKFVEIVKCVKAKNNLIMDAEAEILEGIDHSRIGGWLAAQWKLPSALVQIIGLHHQPELGEDLMKPIACVHLADILIRSLDIGNGGDKKIPRIHKEAWEVLGLDYHALDEIMESIENELTDVELFIAEG